MTNQERWNAKFAEHGLDMDFGGCGGYCPVQAEGTVNGNPFYFRARHGDWSLHITAPNTDPVILPNTHDDSLFRASGYDSTHGWMDTESEVLPLLLKQFKEFASEHT